MTSVKTISWDDNSLIILNQTLLPGRIEYIKCRDWRRVAEAIKRLEVRGAPAIGAAAAFAMVLAARELTETAVASHSNNGIGAFQAELRKIAGQLGQTRPTAVNLFWALERMLGVLGRTDVPTEAALLTDVLFKEAVAIFDEDRASNEKMAAHGATLFAEPTAVLTHCNAGALATAGAGTALGVIRKAWGDGKITQVFADETRPLLQGARLTAWELSRENIPVTLITDSMAGWVMKNKMAGACVVGADRIAMNGDVANKIGTYSLAVLAKEHGIPFYVAAPASTFDFSIESGDAIPIEERDAGEVTCFGGTATAPNGIDVFNPAFDVTPNHLITAIITEHGILRAPYATSVQNLKNKLKSEGL